MRMLAEDELREAVLLIFANKQVSFVPPNIDPVLKKSDGGTVNTCWFSVPPPRFSASVYSVLRLNPLYSISGFAQRYERCRDYWQIGSTFSKKQELVHSGKNTLFRTYLFPLGYKGKRICFEIRAKADTSLEANIVIVYYLAIIFFLYLQLLAVANMYFLFKASVQLQMISVASIVSTRKKQIIYLIFRLHVPPLAKDFTKAWIGCQTSWRMPIAKK